MFPRLLVPSPNIKTGRGSLVNYDVKDLGLAQRGRLRIEWAAENVRQFGETAEGQLDYAVTGALRSRNQDFELPVPELVKKHPFARSRAVAAKGGEGK